MPDLKLNLGSTPLDLSVSGDLVNKLTPGTAGLIELGAELVPLADKTLAQIPAETLTSGFSLDKEGQWTPDGSTVTLSVKPSAGGTIAIIKTGQVFSYHPGDDPGKTVAVTVPAGRVYIALTLNAGLSVAAAGKYSSGDFGVSASISDSDTFAVSNYKSFADSMLLPDALAAAFSSFRLPFSAGSVAGLEDGDYLDFSFIGQLALGFGATWGISGLLLGGISSGQIQESLSNPLGGLAFGAKPTFKASADFSVTYKHNDVFRVVAGRTRSADGRTNTATLYLFRNDKGDLTTKIDAGIEFNANATFDATSRIDTVVNNAAAALEAKLPAELSGVVAPRVTAALKAPEAKLDAFIKEVNTKVGALLDKVNDKEGNAKVQLQIQMEQTTTDTALFQYTFDLNADETLAGLALALGGDFAGALAAPGVTLAPGAFIEHQFVSTTSLGFQFFGLWHWADVSQYFDNVTTTYAGNGVFRLVAKIGESEDSGPVGKTGQCEVYFTASGSETAATRTFADLDVRLVFESTDIQNLGSAAKTVLALEQLGDDMLSQCAMAVSHADLRTKTLKVSCTIPSASFKAITFDPVGTPFPLFHDGPNYNRFASAVVALNNAAPRAFLSFSQWIAYNRTSEAGAGATQLPDRRAFGSWYVPGDLNRTQLNYFFQQAQSFLNLCEDLHNLTGLISQADTEKGMALLLADLQTIMKTDFGYFIQPAMVALVEVMHAGIANVKFSGVAADTISVSFEAVAADASA